MELKNISHGLKSEDVIVTHSVTRLIDDERRKIPWIVSTFCKSDLPETILLATKSVSCPTPYSQFSWVLQAPKVQYVVHGEKHVGF